MEGVERGRGRLSQSRCVLTPEQRQALGIDRFFDCEDAADILGVTEQTIRDAIRRGSLSARYVPAQRGGTKVAVKGWRLIEWRDQLAGVSDGREEDFPKA